MFCPYSSRNREATIFGQIGGHFNVLFNFVIQSEEKE